jgi:hypothetical protein
MGAPTAYTWSLAAHYSTCCGRKGTFLERIAPSLWCICLLCLLVQHHPLVASALVSQGTFSGSGSEVCATCTYTCIYVHIICVLYLPNQQISIFNSHAIIQIILEANQVNCGLQIIWWVPGRLMHLCLPICGNPNIDRQVPWCRHFFR